MAKQSEMQGVHPALLAPMKNTKPRKLTPAERMEAKRDLEKAKKTPTKYNKNEKTNR